VNGRQRVFDRSYYRRPSTSSFRVKRLQLFLKLLEVKPTDQILDVGGRPDTWGGTGLEGNVTILNIDLPESRPQPFRWIASDACEMTALRDHSFDIVFSNSVIEHVGDFGRQEMMAHEVRRVGRKYWVQTPYKHFPIEIHFLFPFYQYLPRPLRIGVGRVRPFSHAQVLGLDPIQAADDICLLDRTGFRLLFTDAQILSERFCGLTKSLIAVRN
jgi:hypothetical protein